MAWKQALPPAQGPCRLRPRLLKPPKIAVWRDRFVRPWTSAGGRAWRPTTPLAVAELTQPQILPLQTPDLTTAGSPNLSAPLSTYVDDRGLGRRTEVSALVATLGWLVLKIAGLRDRFDRQSTSCYGHRAFYIVRPVLLCASSLPSWQMAVVRRSRPSRHRRLLRQRPAWRGLLHSQSAPRCSSVDDHGHSWLVLPISRHGGKKSLPTDYVPYTNDLRRRRATQARFGLFTHRF